MAIPKHTPEQRIARFWCCVDKNGPRIRPDLEPCWIWTANKSSNGHYGLFLFDGKIGRAHRFSYLLNVGPIGDLCVLHRCDNPPCVRPDHLFLGTIGDNNRDCDAKGRRATGPRIETRGDLNGSRLHPERLARGEQHYRAKLNEEQVRKIRDLHREAVMGYKKLARAFGVSRSQARRICRGESWKHSL